MSDTTTTNTQESFHVHSVLDMLAETSQAVTLEELKTLITTKFGANTTFDSCAIDGMNADQVVEFLLARRKVVEVAPGKFQLNSFNSCGH